MDELIDIFNADGKKTGETCMKSIAHKKGIYHASVHIWIYDNSGNILVQRRSIDKDTHPNHWDVSVAGHIGAGESPIFSAIRETKEEIGLQIKEGNLEEIGYFKSEFIHGIDLKDLEYHYTYLCNYQININNLIPQKEEVEELNILSFSDFKKEVIGSKKNLLFVPYGKEYYQFIIDQIKERINNIVNG